MTIVEHLNSLLETLTEWARSEAGSVRIVGDEFEAFDALRSKPGGLVVILLWDSEDPRGEHSELGKVDRTYRIILSRGRGMKLDSGETFTVGDAGGRPLYDLLEEAREMVRNLVLPVESEDPDAEDQRLEYKGSGKFEVQGYLLDALEIRFSVGAQLPTEYLIAEVEE